MKRTKSFIMKNLMRPRFVMLFALSSFLLLSCAKDNNPGDDNGNDDPENSCYVILFDGDNYTDDTILVKGSGEFSNLNNLPNSDKDWDDEADSFKAGKNTTVTFYSEPDFKGESVTYEKGAQKPSVDEPRSMKIVCNK